MTSIQAKTKKLTTPVGLLEKKMHLCDPEIGIVIKGL